MKKTILLILILALGQASVSLATEGTWTAKADMPTARMYLSTSVVNGKIYAIGGASRRERSVPTVEEYDPATDTWTTKSPIPTPRWGFSTSVVNGKIYAIGGAESNPHSPLKTVEEYDPATDTWTTKSPISTARWGLSTSVVNRKIYAIGGGVPTGYRVVEEYDPATDTWTQKASIPTGRYGLSTSAVNGKIYVIGGVVSYPTITFKVEEYDPLTDTWTRKADIPTARAYSATSIVNGQIYVMGGAKLDPDNPPVPTVEAYDPVTDTWTTKADMPTARTVFSTSAVNGKIYVIGGSTTGSWSPDSTTVEEYDPYPLIVDFNGDGIVNSADVCIMIDYWGTDEPLCDIGPMPWGDGIVDVQDLIVLAEHLFDDYRAMAQWKLDEKAGDIAHDSIGGHDGTLQGEPLWQPTGGQVSGALEFDGIDDYVSTPFILNPGNGSLGAFAWIKGSAPGQVIISQTGDFGGTWLGIDPSDGTLMTGFSDMYFGALVSETAVTDGQWHHVGLVYDLDSLHRRLYVDGAQVAEDATVVSGMPSDGGLYIGASKDLDAGTFFSGLIDDVRIYDMALTPEEIETLAQ